MVELHAHGVKYGVRPDVYDPSDDTFLLMEAVRRERPGRLLEVGTGAGLVAIAAAQAGHDVTATDWSAAALRLARANAKANDVRIRFLRAHLTRGIRAESFDTIAFNPPYLPTAPEERIRGPLNRAFDGGPTGLEVAREFLERLDGASTILLVASTLQDAQELRRLEQPFARVDVVAERAMPHERLRVIRLVATRKD